MTNCTVKLSLLLKNTTKYHGGTNRYIPTVKHAKGIPKQVEKQGRSASAYTFNDYTQSRDTSTEGSHTGEPVLTQNPSAVIHTSVSISVTITQDCHSWHMSSV